MCASFSVFFVVLLGLFSRTTCNQPFTAELIGSSLVSLSNRLFTWNLYQTLKSQEGNLIFSPLSAQTVLSMLWLGANGTTANQLQDALAILPESQYHITVGYKNLLREVQNTTKVTIDLAGKLFIQEGFQINSTFQRAMSDGFQSGLQTVDFANNTNTTRVVINQWVDEKTHGKIKEVIADGSLNPRDRLVAVNALYFKGGWLKPFSEEQTATKPFHVSTTRSVSIPMMNAVNHYWYARNSDVGFQVIKLQYRLEDTDQQEAVDESIAMVILLPDTIEGLSSMEEAFVHPVNFNQIWQDMSYRPVNVTIPRFSIEKSFSLVDKLKELGIRQLFEVGADLSGISNEHLYVSQVFQTGRVEVTEKGTEAAATTYMEAIPLAAFSIETFNADHPFLFLIIDEIRSLTLFMGRVVEPN